MAVKKKQKNKTRHLPAILLLIGLTFSGGLFALSYATAETILPGVVVNGVPVSGLRRAEAVAAVRSGLAQRAMTLTYAGQQWTATANDLGLTFDIETAVDTALQQGRNVVSLVSGGVVDAAVTVDHGRLAAYLQALSHGVLSPAVDAEFVVREGLLEIQPEKSGQRFDVEAAAKLLEEHANLIALTISEDVPELTVNHLSGVFSKAQELSNRELTLEIEGKKLSVPASVVASWVKAKKEEALRLTFDDAKLGAYLQEATKQFATAPQPQKVIKSELKTEVMVEGKPGKQLVLADAVNAVTQHALFGAAGPVKLTMTETPRPVQYVDAPAAPIPTGKVIAVDLTQQHAYVYQDSRLVYSLKISSGLNDWTPTGTFKVYAKTKKQKMSGPGYYVPNVPNILWFSGDYSMHGVYWHNDFGIRPRSHGCVGQSVEDSQWTYDFGEVGMPLVIYKS